MPIEMQPIGFVHAPRRQPTDDHWGDALSCVALTHPFGPESLAGLSEFSHVEIIFHFHGVDAFEVETGARHPRDNPAWPAVGRNMWPRGSFGFGSMVAPR